MEKELLMKIDTSADLNFLIYIQNIFYNQNRNEEVLRFPYLSKRMEFKEEFELRYRELWKDISQKIAADDTHDLNIFHKEKELFYQQLFVDYAASFTNFHEVYKSFKAWWESFSGRFSVERCIDELVHPLYVELANSLKESGVEPIRPLQIHLIYDDCLIANNEPSSYFVVVPTKDFFIKRKELVPKLRKCFY